MNQRNHIKRKRARLRAAPPAPPAEGKAAPAPNWSLMGTSADALRTVNLTQASVAKTVNAGGLNPSTVGSSPTAGTNTATGDSAERARDANVVHNVRYLVCVAHRSKATFSFDEMAAVLREFDASTAALREEIERLQQECARLASDRACMMIDRDKLREENERLRDALNPHYGDGYDAGFAAALEQAAQVAERYAENPPSADRNNTREAFEQGMDHCAGAVDCALAIRDAIRALAHGGTPEKETP